MAAGLPDPRVADRADFCARCGYPLADLAAPGRCPECGLFFEADCIVLAGVPQRASVSRTRAIVWCLLLVIWALGAQLFPLFIIGGGEWILLVLILLVGATLAMVLTGKRERRGVERFLIDSSGVTRLGLHAGKPGSTPDPVFIPWGQADGVDFEKVSPVWRRLRVGTRGDGARLAAIVFDAGVRCPEAMAETVAAAIAARVRRARAGDQRREAGESSHSSVRA